MSAIGRYLESVATVVRRSAIPYGYTLTIWTSGAVIEHGHPNPGITQAYLFLLGAVGGFAMVALIASRSAPHRLEPARGDLLLTGVVNVLALGLALGASALLALIPGDGAWPAGAFVATTVYLLVASIELLLAHGAKGAARGDD